MDISNGTIFVSEVTGTAILLLLGCGVVATGILKGSKGEGGGWLLINWGWGLAVFAGIYVAFRSGAHINPAYTLSQWILGRITFTQSLVYYAAELIGAFIGAVIAWLAFKEHFDVEEDAGKKLAVFSTGPAIRNYAWNTLTEVIGTFVLVFVILIGPGQTTGEYDGSAVSGGRCSWACWWSASAPRSVDPPGTRSIRPVTSALASLTSSCRSRARVARTGRTPGSRSSVR